jgi:transposase-like protein
VLSEHKEIAAAKRFLIRAVKQHGPPERVTLDGYPATHAAVADLKQEGVLPSETKIWTNKYLNNLVEQDHRRGKRRIYPMLGFQNFRNAIITISGMELAQKIRKKQFDVTQSKSRMKVRIPQVWDGVLAY